MQNLLLLATTTDSDAASAAAGGVLLLILLAFGCVVWVVPGIIASVRKHHNRGAIWAVTLLTGWTFVGWVIAFVWAFTNPAPQQIVINNNRP
jgi:uncharacterized membrane protein YhaH (DUF805 family)